MIIRKLISFVQNYLFSSKKNSGFTLLEVIIATSILALGVIPLLVTHAASIRNFTESKKLTISVLLGESRLALIEAEKFPQPFSDAGEDEEHHYLYWEETVKVVKPEVMVKATVEISTSKESKRKNVVLTSYIVNLEFEKEEEEEEEEEEE